MERRETRTRERLAGAGRLEKGTEWVAQVQYRLVVSDDYLIIDRRGERNEHVVSHRFGGELRAIDRSISMDDVGPSLTLQLEDGRSCTVSLRTSPVLGRGWYEVLGSGPLE